MLPIRRRKPQIRLQGTAAPEVRPAQAVWGTSPAPFLFSDWNVVYVSFGPSALQGEFYRSLWRLRVLCGRSPVGCRESLSRCLFGRRFFPMNNEVRKDREGSRVFAKRLRFIGRRLSQSMTAIRTRQVVVTPLRKDVRRGLSSSPIPFSGS